MSALTIRSCQATLVEKSDLLKQGSCSIDPASEPSTTGRSLEVECPLKLRLAGVKGGRLDLQLQLLAFKYGSHCDLKTSAKIEIPESLQGDEPHKHGSMNSPPSSLPSQL